MKKIIATLLTFGALNMMHAQGTQINPPSPSQAPAQKPNKPSPEQIATRQSAQMQKMLGLNEDQKQKVYQSILTRITSVQSVRAKYIGNPDRKAMGAELKAVKGQFFQEMGEILTPEQKAKWDAQREKKKEEHQNKRMGVKEETAPAPSSTPQK